MLTTDSTASAKGGTGFESDAMMKWSPVVLNPLSWFRLQPPTAFMDDEAEVGQAKIRFGFLISITIYILAASWVHNDPFSLDPWARNLLIYFAFFAPVALFIYFSAKRKPGHYPARRLLAVSIDLGSLCYAIISNPWIMLPLYSVTVWTIMGNGVRYGRGYLLIATVLGQISLVMIFSFAGFEVVYFYTAATLSLTALLVPIYAWALLGRIDRFRLEAEHSNIAKSQLLAQASHDLRQPIHAIGLFTVSLRELGLNTKQRQIVDRIDRALQSVANLFKSLLDLSSLDSGKIESNPVAIQLNDLLEEIVNQNQSVAQWQGTPLRLVNTGYAILADRVLLSTMVQNLISNALKFTAPGKRILVGARRHQGRISVQVWDQGAGIDPAHIEAIFNEFYQVRGYGSEDRQGVGLGLAIVRRLARLTGCTIRVHSKPGMGSLFSIDHLVETAPPPMMPVQGRAGPMLSQMNSMHILLIEDDDDIRIATQEMLERWGCRVTTCSRIPEQLEDWTLLVSDFDLGAGLTGIDVSRDLDRRLGRKLPVVIITGHDSGMIDDRAGEQDALIIKKPVNPAELRSVIRAFHLKPPAPAGSG